MLVARAGRWSVSAFLHTADELKTHRQNSGISLYIKIELLIMVENIEGKGTISYHGQFLLSHKVLKSHMLKMLKQCGCILVSVKTGC